MRSNGLRLFGLLLTGAALSIISCTPPQPAGPAGWIARFGGVEGDSLQHVTVDRDGNIIAVGSVGHDALDLNGDGDTLDRGEELLPVHGGNDGLILKLDQRGRYLWAVRLGGGDFDSCAWAATDSAGNIVVTGEARGAADLSGDGNTNDQGETPVPGLHGNQDCFMAKFSSEGVCLWTLRLGGMNTDSGECVAVNSRDRIVLAGQAEGNSDFSGDGRIDEPGYGYDDDETAGPPYGGEDMFVAEFEPSGIVNWLKRLGGGGLDRVRAMALDASDAFILTGDVIGNADLDSDGVFSRPGETAGTVHGEQDVFAVKFNWNGLYQWSRRLGGPSQDFGDGVCVTGAGDVVLCGSIDQAVDLNGDDLFNTAPGEGAVPGVNGPADAFLLKLNGASGAFMWCARLGGMDEEEASAVAEDDDGGLFLTGMSDGYMDLNRDGDTNDAGERPAGVQAGVDAFVCGFTADGTLRWSRRMGGASYDLGMTTAVSDRCVLVGGRSKGDADLNGDNILAGAAEIADARFDKTDWFITAFPR